uniref:Uncharacterized protein n=1 Tax=Rhizophora mucronata TaxID=61149 RepID=A0A2P2JW40_RHIMU
MAMGALSFFLPLRHFSCPVIRYSHSSCSSSRTHISKPTSWHCVNLKPTRGRGKTVAFGGRNSSEPNETQFLDEDGVVEDMDGYLNYLSLEYDSVWDTKPSWYTPSFFIIISFSLLVEQLSIFCNVLAQNMA